MTHIENHPFAFIDGTGAVINVAMFATHDESFVDSLTELYPMAVDAISCCDHGMAGIGQIWDGETFNDPEYWSVIPEPAYVEDRELVPLDPALITD